MEKKFLDNNCKDVELINTIDKIKKILDQNGIDVDEKTVENVRGVFSTRLNLSEIGLGTNGKGTSIEMSRASAYGELMERLQNFALYKFMYPIRESDDYNEFIYYCDEEKVSLDEFEHQFKEIYNDLTLDIENIIPLMSTRERKENCFYSTKYIEIKTNKEKYIPGVVAEYMYATNGMAAGNTLEEGVVQGLAEIFERYANRSVLDNHIVAPLIPDDKIVMTPRTKAVIDAIKEKNKDIKIEFRDCSLGIGLPVVQMNWIDERYGKYFVKFGCHPTLEIAIERTLTELFQGRSFLMSPIWLQDFKFEEVSDGGYDHNFEKILRSGDGVYPYSIFGENFSYQYSNCFIETKFDSNKELLAFMMKIVEKNKWNVLYKNLSFMGFPAVHIIVPNVSEVEELSKEYSDRLVWYRECRSKIKRVNECSEDEIRDIIKFFSEMHYSIKDNISYLYSLPVEHDAEINQVNVEYFNYILLAKINENELALKALDNYILANRQQNTKKTTVAKCEKELFYATKIKKIPIDTVEIILKKIYGEETFLECRERVNGKKLLLDRISYPCEKKDCQSCSIVEKCRMSKINNFHKKMVRLCMEGWSKTSGKITE